MSQKQCNGCAENSPVPVPYVVHEGAMAKAERTVKRLWVTVLILIFLFVGSNCVWIWYESQFEDVEITQENTDGYNNFIGNDGDIIYGETDN